MYHKIKRFFDLLFSLLGLILLSPLFLPIMLALRLTGEGEIFYQQKRVGYRNQFFGIWKFATMLKNSPNMGTGSLTLRDDPRVTPVGKWLRITKINELPQLFNVFTGDISFVGPRPQMEVDFKAYTLAVQSRIYSIPPGITGIGSLIFRDEEKWISASSMPVREFYESVIAPYKGDLEMWYLEHRSFLTDLKLLFLTFWVVLIPESQLVKSFFTDLPTPPIELIH